MGQQAPFLDIAERPGFDYRLNFKAFVHDCLFVVKEWNLRVSCSLSFYLMSQCLSGIRLSGGELGKKKDRPPDGSRPAHAAPSDSIPYISDQERHHFLLCLTRRSA